MTRADREIIAMRRNVAIGKFLVFKEEAWRFAELVHAGVIEKIIAIDALQDAAEANLLIDTLGQDFIQAIMADAFDAAAKAKTSEAA
jgi:hypothetical protein